MAAVAEGTLSDCQLLIEKLLITPHPSSTPDGVGGGMSLMCCDSQPVSFPTWEADELLANVRKCALAYSYVCPIG